MTAGCTPHMMHISLDIPAREQNVDLNRIDNPGSFCYKGDVNKNVKGINA
jgi:hypothetical protein